MTYNGHKNWNHWNVSLWLFNDEYLYRQVYEKLRRTPTKDTATQALLDILPTHTPDGAPYTFSSVRAALRGT